MINKFLSLPAPVTVNWPSWDTHQQDFWFRQKQFNCDLCDAHYFLYKKGNKSFFFNVGTPSGVALRLLSNSRLSDRRYSEKVVIPIKSLETLLFRPVHKNDALPTHAQRT